MHTQPTNEGSVPDIKFNVDEFDFDNYEFEPITKGLGFNREKKEIEKVVVRKKVETPVTTPKTGIPATTVKAHEVAAQSSLGSFYQTEEKKEIKKLPRAKSQKINQTKKLLEAPHSSKVLAWAIDFIFVTASFSFSVWACAYILNFQLNYEVLMSLPTEAYAYAAVLFSFFYLFYFTIFEVGQSPGRTMMKQKVVNMDNEQITIQQSFTRALVGLMSFVLLGLPLIVDFQGKLSDTKVCID